MKKNHFMTTKNLMLLIAVLFWTVSCKEENKSTDTNKDPIITLKVQVMDNLDSVKKTLSKETKTVAEDIFRFKVLEAIKGAFNKEEIKIKILFPLESIDSRRLENGKIYSYNLIQGTYINSEMKTVSTDYYEIWEDSPAGAQR